MSQTYQRLMACAQGGDPVDSHVFACILAKGVAEAPLPLGAAVGLGRDQLSRLLARLFPAAEWLLAGVPDDCGEDAIEEPDLRRLMLANATDPDSELAAWLAAMVARRSLAANHLWQDLGLTGRADLSGMLSRHFAPLARRNDRDMKWKKFLYRQLCEEEGVSICKSPVCEKCDDYPLCFGPEQCSGCG
jgi:nitrogen fixation protein NifQ